MGIARQREQRRIVFLRARMRVSDGWTDVTICNVSSRGLMAKCACPPRKGDYVEIRHRGLGMVARVAWSHNSRFGCRTQDAIDLAALLADSPLKPHLAGQERRTASRPRAQPPPPVMADLAERNRMRGRMLDWMLIAAAAAFAAVQLVGVSAEVFSQPIREAEAALAGSGQWASGGTGRTLR